MLAPLSRAREPVSNEVAQVLLRHLVSGEYEPGQRLPPERALADSLNVGRSLIREALKALTLLGLIEVRPGDGTYLRRRPSDLLPASFEWGLLLGENQLEDVIEARRELEIVLAGFAAAAAHRRGRGRAARAAGAGWRPPPSPPSSSPPTSPSTCG